MNSAAFWIAELDKAIEETWQRVGPETLEKDVERAIREARERVGNEFAELLEAPTMTRAEMDAIEGEDTTE